MRPRTRSPDKVPARQARGYNEDNIGRHFVNEPIIVDPSICGGKPVIRGTHTPVATLVSSLARGMSFEEIQREYGVTAGDIRAALSFAARMVDGRNGVPPADPGCFRES